MAYVQIDHVHGLAVGINNPDRILIATHRELMQLVAEKNLPRVVTVFAIGPKGA